MPHPAFAQLSRRAITGVLALWLCVIAAGVWAPMARASMDAGSVERLCSGELLPQWAASPVADAEHGAADALHHLMECPLCLPVLAPPPYVLLAWAPMLPQHVASAPQVAPPQALAQQWPPARGPPFNIFA